MTRMYSEGLSSRLNLLLTIPALTRLPDLPHNRYLLECTLLELPWVKIYYNVTTVPRRRKPTNLLLGNQPGGRDDCG